MLCEYKDFPTGISYLSPHNCNYFSDHNSRHNVYYQQLTPGKTVDSMQDRRLNLFSGAMVSELVEGRLFHREVARRMEFLPL